MQVQTTLLVLGLLWARSLAQLPEATIAPSIQTVEVGHSATFSCTTARAISTTEWRRNNVPISNDPDHSINDSGNTLTVTNAQGGNYTCVAENDAGSVSSNTAVLQLAVHDVNFFSSNQDEPHTVTVIENMPTAIDCGPFSSTPPSDLAWDVPFGSSFVSVSIDNEGATIGLDHRLYLLEPRLSQNDDIFACHLRNTLLGVISNGFVRINVEASTSPAPDPFILVAPQDVTATIGQTVSFECIPGGSGAASRHAVWSPMPANARVSADTFRLGIADITAENSGTYTCTIEGESRSATLTIIDPPVLTASLPASPVSQIYGNPLSLSCSSSTPLITYWEWFHNGNRVSESGPTLTTSSTTLTDSGSYQCIAYNPAGYIQSATTVQVNTIDAEISAPLPSIQVAFSGQPFSMLCSARGAPPPTYVWTKSSFPLESGESFTVTGGELEILTVGDSSEGTYECTATNRFPDNSVVATDTTTTSLRVIRPTTFERELGEMFSVQVATPTILHCNVTHDPRTTVQFSWLKDGEPLDTDGPRVSYLDQTASGNLRIDLVEFADNGTYQCVVNTTLATEDILAPVVRSTPTMVTVTDTPVAPLILSLASSSPKSIQIKWVFSGVPTFVSSYVVEIQSPPDSASPWIPIHTKSTSAVTAADISSDDLAAFTLYGVRVVAMYSEGDPVPSEEHVVLTGTDVPADSPNNVVVTALMDTSALNITWNPPSIPRGVIVHYTIQYKVKGESDYTTVSTPTNATNYAIFDLKQFEEYEIRVAAVTSAGQGPFSPLISVFDGGLNEPESGPFVSSIGFIALMVALVLVLVVCAVVGVLVTRYRCSKEKEQRSYHFRHSGYFGKGVNIVGTETTDGGSGPLSDDAMASYGSRPNRAFTSASPTGSRGDPIDLSMEGGSLFGTITTGTPQLSTGSAARLLNAPAPSYIDPPPFEETVMRSRSQSAHSAYAHDFDKPVRDWDIEQGSGLDLPPTGFPNPGVAYTFDDSDNSMDKNADDFDDTESERTQYSHLAGAIEKNLAGIQQRTSPLQQQTSPLQQSPGTRVFHHQLNLPLSASSSAGVPMSVGEIVDNRLLREQSEDTESPINYATYV